MTDTSIDEEKAEDLLRDVRDESDAVDVILTKVQTSLFTISGEDVIDAFRSILGRLGV